MASAKEVMKKIEDNEVKFVDLRFTDIRGKEQHITVPISHFDEDRFTDGQAFDGSSMGGWRGVQASDMLLIPDPDTAVMDPFREEPTLILTCDVVEPTEGKGYDRDPRSIARRAEAYLQSSGIGDIAYFGPEPEFFIFDSVTWKQDMSGSMVAIDSEEASWSSDRKFNGCARKWSCCWSRWACPWKFTTTRWQVPASARSARSLRRWCSVPTGCSA